MYYIELICTIMEKIPLSSVCGGLRDWEGLNMERGVTHKGYKLAYHHVYDIQSNPVTITAIEEERREATLGRRAPAGG